MSRNGTRSSNRGTEAARLLLRASIGSTMVVHGVRHARTLEGTAKWFDSIGFRRPELQAKTSAAVEIGAGVAILGGIATPLSASAVVGTMAVAARAVHLRKGYFVTNEGYEYVASISASSLALSTLGAGRYSVDRALGFADRMQGGRWATFAGATGVVGAAIQLAAFWRRPKGD